MTAARPLWRDFKQEPVDGYSEWFPDFAEFAACFDTSGPPGITQEWREWHGYQTACLLYRDNDGLLAGVHLYYAATKVGEAPEHYFPGHTETIVRPDQRGKGVGTALLLESVRRFHTDLDVQYYTRGGYAIARRVRAILNRHPSWRAYNTLKAQTWGMVRLCGGQCQAPMPPSAMSQAMRPAMHGPARPSPPTPPGCCP